MDGEAPIELYGYHDEFEVILARREGEPDFVWVQDIGDAFQAAGVRGVDVVVTREFRDELLAHGDLPPVELNGLRIIRASVRPCRCRRGTSGSNVLIRLLDSAFTSETRNPSGCPAPLK